MSLILNQKIRLFNDIQFFDSLNLNTKNNSADQAILYIFLIIT
jgi:hypothetical protein